MSTFGERIQGALKARGITAAELARRVGVKSKSTVHAWKHGTAVNVYPENLVAAARALDVDVVWLATGEGKMEPDRIAVNGVNLTLMESTVTIVVEALRERGLRLTPEEVGKLVVLVYEMSVEVSGPIRKATVLRLIQATS